MRTNKLEKELDNIETGNSIRVRCKSLAPFLRLRR